MKSPGGNAWRLKNGAPPGQQPAAGGVAVDFLAEQPWIRAVAQLRNQPGQHVAHGGLRQGRRGNRLAGLLSAGANQGHGFPAALPLAFAKGGVLPAAPRVPLALALPCALLHALGVGAILLVMLVVPVGGEGTTAFKAFAPHDGNSLQSFSCIVANAAKKNGAENGGRKREPKEETDSFPWKSAKKTEEKPNHNRQALPSGMAD